MNVAPPSRLGEVRALATVRVTAPLCELLYVGKGSVVGPLGAFASLDHGIHDLRVGISREGQMLISG
jgi:hypothetical protein